MTSKPPFNGRRVRLGELCAKGKSSLRQKDILNGGAYSVYGASGVVGSMATYQNEQPYVAVVKDGAGVGRAMLCDAETSVLGTMQALLPKEGCNSKYLLHLIRSLKLGEGFSGSTIPHIYYKNYSKAVVPFHDPDEQKVIANSLDLAEQIISQSHEVQTLLDNLVKSRFIETFGDGTPKKTIGELATDIRYGTSKKASDAGHYTYLRMNNLTDDGRLNLADVKSIDLEGPELEKCMVVKGDLLFNRTNSREKVGKTAVFLEDVPMVAAGYIIRVRLGSEMLSEFLSTFMNLQSTKTLLRSIAKGAVHQANINSKELASIEVPAPSMDAQNQFVTFMHQVDKSRLIVQQQIEKLQTLYDSLSQEYFG